MTSEYINGHPYHAGANSLWLDGMAPPSTERSLVDEFMEEASSYLENLAQLNSLYTGIVTDGTAQPYYTTPHAPYFQDIPRPTRADPDTKPPKGPTDDDGPAIAVYEDGRRQYKCAECGKRHDRKSRADDCRNVDLGIKPYKCHGECGRTFCEQSYASEALLRRHRGPQSLRFAECAQCHLQLYKQNLARHLRICKGSQRL